jgi:GH35 family endo-1,4-beta-xylanase/beta-xylosidase
MINKLLTSALALLVGLPLCAQTATLRSAFANDFLLGCAVNEHQSSGKDKQGAQLAAQHFNSVVAENVMKCEVIHPKENKYDWKKSDAFVKFGEDNNMFVVGHCLIWHSQLAKWFCVDKHGKLVSPEVLKQRMRDHIHTIVGRYKGRVKGWDVVNEAILEDGSYRNSQFYQILGEEYIPLAFQYAHEADPDAELYYNDYGMDSPARRASVIKMVNNLKARGLRIDAIGMQSHIGVDYPDFKEFEKSIKAFAATGCKVNITELDMSALPSKIRGANISDKMAYSKEWDPYKHGLTKEASETWNARMRKFFELFLKYSDKIERVNFWGVTDRDSWKNDWPIKGRTDYPLAFDRNGDLKPFLQEYVNTRKATFSSFSYNVPNGLDVTPNPLLHGCYPDPTIINVDGDFYLANSTFSYYPGVPIWHSTDLKNWQRLGFVLNRPSQLELPDSIRIAGGVYAPALAYNPANKLFYMINTLVDNGGNYYVTTPDPKSGVWSDPVWLPEVGGIDPSFLFDTDGKAYIVNNDVPVGGPTYDGHRAIFIREFDWQTGKVCSEQRMIINGGVNPAENPVWIEGPHLYHINGKYFLMCAEGGTGTDHSEVIFESNSLNEPFTPCKINPILTQKDLSKGRENAVTCAGHADLVQGADGNWYAVFLAVRPYTTDNHDIMGRETYMLPVQWVDGQPIIQYPEEPIAIAPKKVVDARLWTDSGLTNDAFMLRNPVKQLYTVSNGNLVLDAKSTKLVDRKAPAMVCRWVTELEFEASTTVSFNPETADDVAGLLLFQDDDHYITLGISRDDSNNLCVKLSDKCGATLNDYTLPIDSTSADLKVAADGKGTYSFFVNNKKLDKTISADILSTKTANNFTGTAVGVYATAKY